MSKKQIMTLLLALDLVLVSCAAVAGMFCLHWNRQMDTVPDSGYSEKSAELTHAEEAVRQQIAHMHDHIAQRNEESKQTYAQAQIAWSEKYNALQTAKAELEALTGEKG